MPTPREAYVNSVERQGFSGARIRPVDISSGAEAIGRATQGLGQDLQKVSNDLLEIQKHDAEVAAQEADNIRLAKRLKRYYEGPEGFFNQEGRNALTDKEKLTADLEAIDREAAELLKGKPMAQRMFDGLTQRRNADDLPKIFSHVSTQRNKYEEQVDADAFDLAIDNAASSEDPLIIEENIATAGNLAVKQAMRKGMLDDNTLRQARQSGIGKAVEAIAQRLEVKSPSEAQAFVTTHADQMDPQDTAKLLAALAPGASKERASTDIGSFLVLKGGNPVAPAPAADASAAGPTLSPPEAALEAAQLDQESGGRHTDASGRLITSSAGARGVSQVMPDTGVDPGYGVAPLRNHSREEYVRFRREYMAAMKKEYGGNIVLALTAYNWGPGNLNAHIAKVGDPRKGTMSDAEFLATIPVKEAREYAPLILDRTGVSVSGRPGPNAVAVDVGQEIDLDATINAINKSDRTYRDKEALIAEAKERYSLGKQVRNDAEAALKDQVATEIGKFKPGEFTDFNKLPLTLRTQLDAFPQLRENIKGQAATNKEAQLSEQQTEKAAKTDLVLRTLLYNSPAEFNAADLVTGYPELNPSQRTALLALQATSRKQLTEGANNKTANHEKMRTYVNRFKTGYDKDLDVAPAYTRAIQKEEEWLRANPGKEIPDTVREGIAREVMMPVWADGKRIPRFAAPEVNGRLRGVRVNPREQVRAELQQAWGRYPTEDEITHEVDFRARRGTYSQ